MPDEIISEFDRHGGDDDWFSEGQEIYDTMLEELIEDFPGKIDQHAADLMYDGWFNPDTDRLDSVEIRFEFFDYTGLEWEDFDWDAWREWYES